MPRSHTYFRISYRLSFGLGKDSVAYLGEGPGHPPPTLLILGKKVKKNYRRKKSPQGKQNNPPGSRYIWIRPWDYLCPLRLA